MQILLTNDDGIYSPGLAALEKTLRKLGDVFVVAPAYEQSGVSHSITFLMPLTVQKMTFDGGFTGWAVNGTPADCAKLAVTTLCPKRPDLVVSGINFGLNAGNNTLYSGTISAAAEGLLCGITSFAVSLEASEEDHSKRASELATNIIEQILKYQSEQKSEPQLYNINMPIAAMRNPTPQLKIVKVDRWQFHEGYEVRTDLLGRQYYWLDCRPDRRRPKLHELSEGGDEQMTDEIALAMGFMTLSPLEYNMTKLTQLDVMRRWTINTTPERATE